MSDEITTPPAPSFLPGLRLSALLYAEAVKPLLARYLPHLKYAAGLLGSGSEVLGFDTVRSTDHHWGPRLQLFVSPDDEQRHRQEIYDVLAQHLPHSLHGYPTNFGAPDAVGVRLMELVTDGPINHRVTVTNVRAFFTHEFGFDLPERLTPIDWLLMPEQRLRTFTAGAVYRDDLGKLKQLRTALHYYPHDIWLYLMAVQWRRISQEDAFVGRTGEVGDDVGSRLVAARLVNDLMRLCFLMERQYAPYAKWFGAAFSRLRCAAEFTPVFSAVLGASTWQEREEHLSRAYSLVASKHNGLGITAPLDTRVSPFHERPFLVIQAGTFRDAIREGIEDEEVRRLPADVGSVDQFTNSTDVLSYPAILNRLRSIYALS